MLLESVERKWRKLSRATVRALFYNQFVLSLTGTITHFADTDALALTFDDGPHPDYTPRLLEILARHQVRATFFPVGEFAHQHPELVRRVAEAGHAIGNHSWSHAAFPFITGREQREQIRAAANILAPYEQRIFRPPYGYENAISHLNALWLGYQVVGWSVQAEDWFDREAGQITDRLLSQIKRGSIVILHERVFDALNERYFDREPTLKAVEMLLERLGHRFRFLTIPELIQSARPQRVNWYLPSNKLENVRKTLNKLKRQEGEARFYGKAAV
jgi:peptidoglycan/xylan/chitin deacetylase (PgdA/CDA1 family)